MHYTYKIKPGETHPINFGSPHYQNLTYNADSMRRIHAISAIDEGRMVNISASSENAFALIFGPARLIKTITRIVIKKDHPILTKKGIS